MSNLPNSSSSQGAQANSENATASPNSGSDVEAGPGANEEVFDSDMQQSITDMAQNIRKMSVIELFISNIQINGVLATVSIFPPIFRSIWQGLSVPFSLSFPTFGVEERTMFYFEMIIPVCLYICWRYLARSPYRWKQSFITNWNWTIIRYFVIFSLIGIILSSALWVTKSPDSTDRNRVAIGFGFMTGVIMYFIWFLVLTFIRFKYTSSIDEGRFFIRMRVGIQTGLLIVSLLLYLPISQAIATVLKHEVNSTSADVLVIIVAIISLLAYVILFPILLFIRLRKEFLRSRAGEERLVARASLLINAVPLAAAVGSSTGIEMKQTEDERASLVNHHHHHHHHGQTLEQDDDDVKSVAHTESGQLFKNYDFISYGHDAAVQSDVLSIIIKYSSLAKSASRITTTRDRLTELRTSELTSFQDSLDDYLIATASDPFRRLSFPFHDSSFWWRCAQLIEKCLIVFIISFASSSPIYQLTFSLVVISLMLVLALRFQPYKQHHTTSIGLDHVGNRNCCLKGKNSFGTENFLDLSSRITTLLTILIALIVRLSVKTRDKSDVVMAVDVVLVTMNLLNMLFMLYEMDLREVCKKMLAAIKNLPKTIEKLKIRKQKGMNEASKELFMAVVDGNEFKVRSILDRKVADINWLYSSDDNDDIYNGLSCMHVAPTSVILDLLIQSGGDPCLASSKHRSTPLHVAYENGFGTCVNLLLTHNVSIVCQDDDHKVPKDRLLLESIERMVRTRNAKDAEWIVSQDRFLNSSSPEAKIAWIKLAAEQKSWEVLPLLVSSMDNSIFRFGSMNLEAEGLKCLLPIFKKSPHIFCLDLCDNNITHMFSTQTAVAKLSEFILESRNMFHFVVEIDLRGNSIRDEMSDDLIKPIQLCCSNSLTCLNGIDFRIYDGMIADYDRIVVRREKLDTDMDYDHQRSCLERSWNEGICVNFSKRCLSWSKIVLLKLELIEVNAEIDGIYGIGRSLSTQLFNRVQELHKRKNVLENRLNFINLPPIMFPKGFADSRNSLDAFKPISEDVSETDEMELHSYEVALICWLLANQYKNKLHIAVLIFLNNRITDKSMELIKDMLTTTGNTSIDRLAVSGSRISADCATSISSIISKSYLSSLCISGLPVSVACSLSIIKSLSCIRPDSRLKSIEIPDKMLSHAVYDSSFVSYYLGYALRNSLALEYVEIMNVAVYPKHLKSSGGNRALVIEPQDISAYPVSSLEGLLAGNNSVQRLTISTGLKATDVSGGCRLDSEFLFRGLSTSPSCQILTSLNLVSCMLSPSNCGSLLSSLCLLVNLKHLDLSYNFENSYFVSCASSSSRKILTTRQFRSKLANGAVVYEGGELSDLSGTLPRCCIDAPFVFSLCKLLIENAATCSRLASLSLAGCAVVTGGFKTINADSIRTSSATKLDFVRKLNVGEFGILITSDVTEKYSENTYLKAEKTIAFKKLIDDLKKCVEVSPGCHNYHLLNWADFGSYFENLKINFCRVVEVEVVTESKLEEEEEKLEEIRLNCIQIVNDFRQEVLGSDDNGESLPACEPYPYIERDIKKLAFNWQTASRVQSHVKKVSVLNSGPNHRNKDEGDTEHEIFRGSLDYQSSSCSPDLLIPVPNYDPTALMALLSLMKCRAMTLKRLWLHDVRFDDLIEDEGVLLNRMSEILSGYENSNQRIYAPKFASDGISIKRLNDINEGTIQLFAACDVDDLTVIGGSHMSSMNEFQIQVEDQIIVPHPQINYEKSKESWVEGSLISLSQFLDAESNNSIVYTVTHVDLLCNGSISVSGRNVTRGTSFVERDVLSNGFNNRKQNPRSPFKILKTRDDIINEARREEEEKKHSDTIQAEVVESIVIEAVEPVAAVEEERPASRFCDKMIFNAAAPSSQAFKLEICPGCTARRLGSNCIKCGGMLNPMASNASIAWGCMTCAISGKKGKCSKCKIPIGLSRGTSGLRMCQTCSIGFSMNTKCCCENL